VERDAFRVSQLEKQLPLFFRKDAEIHPGRLERIAAGKERRDIQELIYQPGHLRQTSLESAMQIFLPRGIFLSNHTIAVQGRGVQKISQFVRNHPKHAQPRRVDRFEFGFDRLVL